MILLKLSGVSTLVSVNFGSNIILIFYVFFFLFFSGKDNKVCSLYNNLPVKTSFMIFDEFLFKIISGLGI